MESQRATRTSISLRLLAGMLILAVMPRMAMAANDTIIDCDRLASSLRSLDVPAAEMPLDDVDHMATDDSELLPVVLESETVAPVLLLTPRVADLMREVFDSLPGESDKGSATTDSSEESAQSPAVAAPLMPVEADNATPAMPSFQREMYRTDI